MTNQAIWQEDVTQQVDVVLQDKLEKSNITDHTLSALKAELTEIAAIKVEDKKSLALVQGGITKAVNIRNNIVRICKKGREAALMEQRAWIAKEKELVGVVEAMEKPLVALKEAYIAEQDRIEREELERKEAEIKSRFAAIEGFGFTRRTGVGREDYFSNGKTEVEIADISTADEEAWAMLADSLERDWRIEQERLKAEEEAKRQEEERMRKEAAALEARMKELQEREAAMNARVNEARKNELLAVGLEMIGDNIGIGARGKELFNLAAYRLHEIPDTQWADELLAAKAAVEERNLWLAEKEEAEAKAYRERVRYARMTEAGYSSECGDAPGDKCFFTFSFNGEPWSMQHEECYALSDQDFDMLINRSIAEHNRRKEVEIKAAKEQAVKEEHERIMREAKAAREKEEERIRQLSDAQRWEEWVMAVSKSAPRMASEIGKHAVKRVLDGIGKMTPGIINDLKK